MVEVRSAIILQSELKGKQTLKDNSFPSIIYIGGNTYEDKLF